MKISTASWHYRYMEWLDLPHGRNLCSYFWLVVFVVVSTPLVLPLFLGLTKWVDRTPREPGLLRSWLRAKKQGVCPLIDFVDPD